VPLDSLAASAIFRSLVHPISPSLHHHLIFLPLSCSQLSDLTTTTTSTSLTCDVPSETQPAMPPLTRGPAAARSIPTLLSISKLLHLVPAAITSSSHLQKRNTWSNAGMSYLAEAGGGGAVEPEDPPDSPQFWWKFGLSVGLVLLGGVFAGLVRNSLVLKDLIRLHGKLSRLTPTIA
jgi:hypothetical protein